MVRGWGGVFLEATIAVRQSSSNTSSSPPLRLDNMFCQALASIGSSTVV